ncbi:MAG TPA: nitroreductase family protein [Streptosporangiaceae bacterium]|nr:nitroreductase family protein [Streptosporangiaceae bacterium]
MAEHALNSRSDRSADPDNFLVDELLRAAVAAPSMHNTQPWRLRLADSWTIELYLDPARTLPVSDPQGRGALIACGAALLNLRMTAAAHGLRTRLTLSPDPAQPLLIARAEMSAGHAVTAWERELSGAIPARRSNREPFTDAVVPPAIKAELAAAAKAEAGILRFLDENEAARVRRLASDAERDLRADPAYRAELARWVTAGRQDDGIPNEILGPRSAVGSDPVRDFDPGRRQAVRYADFEDRPQFVVLSVRAQNAASWIAAGQALERVWLTATCRGVSLCPLTQPLETADAWLVKDARLGLEYPQMIMRIGYGPQVKMTAPRRSISDVAGWS